ncbi:MAG: 5-formyltetrahydrofolate cyclo-ligase [Heteroscytonema crispum UTEX LB 1556]
MSYKIQLRRSLLKTRKSMSVTQWRERSLSICTHLQTSPLFTEAKTILAYFSFRQEPDLSLLFANIFQGGQDAHLTKHPTKHHTKIWGFPRCVGKSLSWHFVETFDATSLQTGAYGITEPHPDTPTIQSNEVDLILVPAVACDYQGYRLGYGGGYYDRLLSSPQWSTKPTIGIVFDFAYLPQLPIETWDKPLQNVCTETGLK